MKLRRKRVGRSRLIAVPPERKELQHVCYSKAKLEAKLLLRAACVPAAFSDKCVEARWRFRRHQSVPRGPAA